MMISVFAPAFSPTIERVIAGVKDFIRYRNSKLRNEPLRSNRKMLTQYIYNVAEEQLNSVAETVSCKQLIFCVMIKELTIYKMTLNAFSKDLTDLI